jgi:superfamily II DNA or RNA helicase
MADSATKTEALRSRLVDRYDNLSPITQLIVQLFSVIYEPISRATFIICLNQTGAKDKTGEAFTVGSLKTIIDDLLAQEILVQRMGLGPECHPLLMEIATRDAVRVGRFEPFAKVVQERLPVTRRWKDGPRYFATNSQLIREVRIGLYRGDIKFIYQQLADYVQTSYLKDKLNLEQILQQVCTNPFDASWFRSLPEELYEQGIIGLLQHSLERLAPADEVFELLQSDCTGSKSCSTPQQIVLAEQLLLRGDVVAAELLTAQLPDDQPLAKQLLLGTLAFLRGQVAIANTHYTNAMQALKKASGKRKIYFHSINGLFYILLLIQEGSRDSLALAVEYTSIGQQANHWLSDTYGSLNSLAKTQQGNLNAKTLLLHNAPSGLGNNSLETLIQTLCLYWVDETQAHLRSPKLLEIFYKRAKAAGYKWLAMEAAELLARITGKNSYAKQSESFYNATSLRPLVGLIQPQEAWELSLKALTSLYQDSNSSTTAKPTATSKRLAWFVSYYSSRNCSIQPREQAISAKGGWGRGRPIALKRLARNADEFDYLTPQDLKVCQHLKPTYSYSYNDYSFDEKAILELVGHPLVFWEDAPTSRIEVAKGEPELLVKKRSNEQLMLQFSPSIESDRAIVVEKESPTRLKVIQITDAHRQIATILGNKNRLEVPAAAKDRVLDAIRAVSNLVTIHSDIGGGVACEEVPSDAKPHVHLLPAGEGLKIAVLVRPFATGGPYYRPGKGGETVIAEIEGKRVQTSRELKQEKKLANAAISGCPTLANYEEEEGEWVISDPEHCLEFLLELDQLGDQVIIEWPEGEKLRVTHQAGLNNFKININRQNDWFAASGELQLDDDLILDMQRLMELLDRTPSRFIPLENGQFLALTQEFRKRLDELRTFSDRSGKGLRMHPLAALGLEDWIDEVGSLKADKHWKQHIQRLKDIQTLEPEVPSTLQAELRDYQIDGFKWLARLAHWGVGACLADDMGLGKTLQSIAVILTRAAHGPTLIVAPTSVGMNWISEAERFAPTLNVIQFGSGNRQKVLDSLQPFDMVVCSYGLLQQEEVAEMLAAVNWHTIVLDEAQSIKNFATKRSQAAMNLKGDFKIITTGTPIENHLGELWNLFRFINPGLLGSLESFNQRFATPIERYGDRTARSQLKKLIQPFILRRTKAQVLQELPSRTEILLQVELSPEELAFYEALRREAMQKLSDSDATAGAKHLQVLAEIMRLRRACCNTKLVKPDLALPSAKLNLFGEVLTELLENRHKALVFSQFVDHLSILRDYLDQQKIAYQYLDGSTPAPERKKRVDAFQSGQGDVFLISLKAGGTGLNLTAADYVIHMDPWWNPAVEDQASDRAHRIGQQRPVTIYRLVAKNTIEEKIVELHASKRDLADSLLEGSEISGKISTEQLLQLINEG